MTNLPEEQHGDFAALTTESLWKKITRQSSTGLICIAAQRGKTNHSLNWQKRLTRLAYPKAAETMITVLAKDQFIDALPDEDMRLRIRQSRPPTLRQALETALELESYSMASKRARPVERCTLKKRVTARK